MVHVLKPHTIVMLLHHAYLVILDVQMVHVPYQNHYVQPQLLVPLVKLDAGINHANPILLNAHQLLWIHKYVHHQPMLDAQMVHADHN